MGVVASLFVGVSVIISNLALLALYGGVIFLCMGLFLMTPRNCNGEGSIIEATKEAMESPAAGAAASAFLALRRHGATASRKFLSAARGSSGLLRLL